MTPSEKYARTKESGPAALNNFYFNAIATLYYHIQFTYKTAGLIVPAIHRHNGELLVEEHAWTTSN